MELIKISKAKTSHLNFCELWHKGADTPEQISTKKDVVNESGVSSYLANLQMEKAKCRDWCHAVPPQEEWLDAQY